MYGGVDDCPGAVAEAVVVAEGGPLAGGIGTVLWNVPAVNATKKTMMIGIEIAEGDAGEENGKTQGIAAEKETGVGTGTGTGTMRGEAHEIDIRGETGAATIAGIGVGSGAGATAAVATPTGITGGVGRMAVVPHLAGETQRRAREEQLRRTSVRLVPRLPSPSCTRSTMGLSARFRTLDASWNSAGFRRSRTVGGKKAWCT